MAHNLEIINGKASAFFADSGAWHELGTVVQGARSWKDAIQLAKLDWQVQKSPLFDSNGNEVAAWGIFRGDNGSFLGAVGQQYTPIQNEYAFDFVDSILGVDQGAHYESAGVLGQGERIWTLARVPHDFSVDGVDPHLTYLLFTTSHDGSLSATAKLTTVRVVCQNTLNAALSGNGSALKIKHTRQAEQRLEAAKKFIGCAVEGVKSVEERLNRLAYKMMTKESFKNVLDNLFPAPKGKEDEISTRRQNILIDIAKRYESNDNNAFPQFRGTAFNMLNAVTEYTDHERSVRLTPDRKHLTENQARQEASLFGTGATLKEHALDIILEATASNPDRPKTTYYAPAPTPDKGNGSSSLDALADLVSF